MAFTQDKEHVLSRIAEWAKIVKLLDSYRGADRIQATYEVIGWTERHDEPFCRRMWVNLYEQGQSWGGPEEGGWWFETLDPVASIPVHTDDMAKRAVDLLFETAESMFGHERQYTSAAGGVNGWVSFESHPGKSSPDERPRYE